MLTVPVPRSELSKCPTSGLLCDFKYVYFVWSDKKQKNFAFYPHIFEFSHKF